MRTFKRIQALHPYQDYWLYVVMHRKENRRMANLVLKSDTKIRTTMSYARYLMSAHLGRTLAKDEQVDHIDGNKLNDVIENFQLLSKADNTRKRYVETKTSKVIVELVCPICNNIFTMDARNVRFRAKRGIRSTCSRKCSGKLPNFN